MRSGQSSGYTIVEVMIFIAVSSAIFFSAMTAIGGRQQQVQFTQSVRTFDSQLNDLMNDVSTGFFPSLGNVQCYISPQAISSDRPVLGVPVAGSNTEQGKSDNCIFVGKALHFAPLDDVDVTEVHHDKINVYTLIGRKIIEQDQVKRDVTSIAEANPKVVAVGTDTIAQENDFTNEITLDWGLRINEVLNLAGDQSYGALGLFNTFAATGGSAELISNSQVVDLAPITTTAIGSSKSAVVNILNKITSGDEASEVKVPLNPTGGIVLCLSNPDKDRKAAIIISSDRRRLSTSVIFDQLEDTPCS